MKVKLEENVLRIREDYKEAHEETLKAERKEQELLELLRKTCKHEYVAEVPYEPEGLVVSSSPPFRICEGCGIKEEGWGTGYNKLRTSRVRAVTREVGGKLWQPIGDIDY